MKVEETSQQQIPPSLIEGRSIAPQDSPRKSRKFILIFAIFLILVVAGKRSYYLTAGKSQSISQNPSTQASISPSASTKETSGKNGSIFLAMRSGIPFDVIVKSAKAQVLGESTATKKNIPVQIFAFEDHNGNGVREPDDNALGFMPVNIYDSPFSSTPVSNISSTGSGWASVLIETGEPYQLVVNPASTKDYYPTTKSIIVSEKNNFAVVGFEKRKEASFHISVFAFEDANKDSNFNYDDKNEKPLFLAPFKFYQQNESGAWDLLPNPVNSTDTGWATTTLAVKYPYIVKIEAGDLDNLTPSSRELTTSYNNATLIFPYINK